MIIPTRIIRHADGRIEVVRVVMPPPPENWSPNDPLAYESSLVWLLPLEALDYVRVAVIHNAQTRRGPLALKNNVILAGYSKLADNAPAHPRTQCFTRRLFYLTLDDGGRNLIDVPEVAIDPATLLPGHLGAPPDTDSLQRAYPRHLRRSRRSHLKNPIRLGPVMAVHHGLQLAAS